MNSKNTAILIFANSAQKEAVNKPFSKSSALFNELNNQTLQKAKRSGMPYFLFSEEKQKGNTFGERYTNAIQFVYNQGFQNVITIGNDTPQLQTSQLIETAKKLEESPIVLGPSTDGGYYLMGLNKSHFNKAAFLKLPWQTARLTRHIARLLDSNKVKIQYLNILSDIDDLQDAQSILNSFKTLASSIRKILYRLFTSNKVIISESLFSFQKFLKENNFNKGSPSLLHI